MTYEDLVDFIQHRMRMSHIYQPVMLQTLLEKGGRATEHEIAQAILAKDESQIEYYEQITLDGPQWPRAGAARMVPPPLWS